MKILCNGYISKSLPAIPAYDTQLEEVADFSQKTPFPNWGDVLDIIIGHLIFPFYFICMIALAACMSCASHACGAQRDQRGYQSPQK